MSDWTLGLVWVAVLTVAGAVVRAAGTALVSVRRARMRDLADDGSSSARRVLRFLEDPSRSNAGTQALVTVIWLLTAAVAAVTVGPSLRDLFLRSGAPLAHAHATALAVVLLTAAVALVVLVFGEIIPRTLAVELAERIALGVALPAAWVARIALPLVGAATGIANLFLRPVGLKARVGSVVLSEEELMMMVEAGEEDGVIEEDEREMIDSVLEFTDTVVRQVMVPRIDMNVLEDTDTVDQAVEEILRCGHSRIPVYQDTVDNIVGIVLAKDLLRLQKQGGGKPVRGVMRPAFFVPENKKVSDLLAEFRAGNQQLAIVRDEYGGTAGLVTVEDLIEEIVGEIRDEYDQEEPQIIPLEGSRWALDARLSIEDLNEELDLDLPEDEYETVGGFVFGLLGTEPKVGDSVVYEGWRFTITEKKDSRLRKIEAAPVSPEQQA